MSPESHSPRTVRASSAARALNLIGDRWTLMALYAAFTGVSRFDGFVAQTGMARSLLTDRLARLEAAGILERRLYQARPPRHDYHLTAMGWGLFDAVLMVLRWDQKRVGVSSHRPLHATCGCPLVPEMACKACGEVVGVREVTIAEGPGAGFDPAPPPRGQRRSIAAERGGDPAVERAIAVLGDRWTSYVAAAAFLGRRRFGDLQAELNVASNILSDRLGRLVALGVLEKIRYQERPERWEYRLTADGRELFPLIVALMAWGDRWLARPEGPPEVLTHVSCGQRLEAVVRCSACGGAVGPETVVPPNPSPLAGEGGGEAVG
ncbi:winged helix-turn-helix transcriptional regulator [Caulobacter hibisci]|uniref:Helix-turn-helix transcriptional regulator n=1 Tax=Caulobacter hibisci TaxID=2035993 RepID=A0ABS0T3Z4_9CAUL|nr:helix-turn-helix domain-containing protein [Caulobacter hibisci]MBI1686588.1 helix-turn-helix transcriptional regulator [Caulobacter hibisci]